LLIWDQVGRCPKDFSATDVLNETGLLRKKVRDKEITHSEMLKVIRYDTVRAMVDNGRTSYLILNLADQHIDFAKKFASNSLFPADKVFNFADWRKNHD
jgi:hypothetical protein